MSDKPSMLTAIEGIVKLRDVARQAAKDSSRIEALNKDGESKELGCNWAANAYQNALTKIAEGIREARQGVKSLKEGMSGTTYGNGFCSGVENMASKLPTNEQLDEALKEK